MLKIRSLTKKFKEKTVLMDVNLDIHSGSVFGLIGPNGSGKSTLLKIMAGIMKPDLGCIADILQITQIMTGYDYSHFLFLDHFTDCPFKGQPHHRIQTVKCLVKKQIFW